VSVYNTIKRLTRYFQPYSTGVTKLGVSSRRFIAKRLLCPLLELVRQRISWTYGLTSLVYVTHLSIRSSIVSYLSLFRRGCILVNKKINPRIQLM